jgi:hypothetical protein
MDNRSKILSQLEPIHVFRDHHNGKYCGYRWIAVTEQSITETIPEGALVSIFKDVVFTCASEAKSFWNEHINERWLGLGLSEQDAIDSLIDRNRPASLFDTVKPDPEIAQVISDHVWEIM